MAEHYCSEHGVAFTAKKNKDGETFWSHKTEDGWCNEPKPQKNTAPTKTPAETPDRQVSIETQNSYTGGPNAVRIYHEFPNDPLAQAVYNYASSKLANWFSQGQEVREEPADDPPAPKATEAQCKKIYATAKEKGYENDRAVAIMMHLYHKGSSKELTKREASEFIEVLSQGKYLEEIEPEDLPF